MQPSSAPFASMLVPQVFYRLVLIKVVCIEKVEKKSSKELLLLTPHSGMLGGKSVASMAETVTAPARAIMATVRVFIVTNFSGLSS